MAATVAFSLMRHAEAVPLTVDSPVPVSASIVGAGDMERITLRICNTTSDPLESTLTSLWMQAVPEFKGAYQVPADTAALTIAPGCASDTFTFTVSETLAPGSWRLDGYIELGNGARIFYHSDSFSVR